MQVEKEHIQKWIRSGQAMLVSADTSKELAEYLDALPWNSVGTRLAWDLLGGVEVNLARHTEELLSEWVRAAALGTDQYLIFLYGRKEPCIACELKFGIANIDYAFSGAPGVRYMFGATTNGKSICPVPGHFAEYDGADRLIAKR